MACKEKVLKMDMKINCYIPELEPICADVECKESDDPLSKLVGKVCSGKTTDGRRFLARLIEVNGNELWFETKRGKRILNKRESIVYLLEAC